MSLEPLGDRVVVRLVSDVDTTLGGVVIPESVRGTPNRGVVLATGEGQWTYAGELVPFKIEVGDQVLFGADGGTTVQLEDEEFVILRYAELLARVV